MNIKSNSPVRLLMQLIILVFFNQPASAQEKASAGPIGIKAAIDIALANNNGLRADSLNITATAFRNKELAGRYLPQVNYNSKLEYNAAIPSQMLPGAIAG